MYQCRLPRTQRYDRCVGWACTLTSLLELVVWTDSHQGPVLGKGTSSPHPAGKARVADNASCRRFANSLNQASAASGNTMLWGIARPNRQNKVRQWGHSDNPPLMPALK